MLPFSASAEGLELAPGLTLTGDVMLQHSVDAYYEYTDIIADLRLFWRPVTDTSFSFGIEASTDSFIGLHEDWSDNGLYAAAVFGFEGYDLRIGAPRPVSDTMALLPPLGAYRYVSLGVETLHGSVVRGNARWDDRFTPGLSLQSNTDGAFAWGLSAHKSSYADQGYRVDVPVVEAVAQYSFGDLTLGAQIVHTRMDDGEADQEYPFAVGVSGTSAMIGMRYAKNGWLLGLAHGKADTGDAEQNFSRVHGSYDFGNGLTLYADLTKADRLYEDDPSGYQVLGAQYRFANGFYLEAGVTHDRGEYTHKTIAAGYKF
ncbi:porin [Xinfangfangia sp. CPCC 101601]|uniref:Porin n=1 Tax=Pseudogemmobacter lacusdianii TaxID=3069608 RepID=A0ABU0VUQ0_9RHOB|nr:porin [Xinfangfangia sp. CPCC 101601]MDQ2065451.1 porin [Xinfangfangia sp. CPCC 101601]